MILLTIIKNKIPTCIIYLLFMCMFHWLQQTQILLKVVLWWIFLIFFLLFPCQVKTRIHASWSTCYFVHSCISQQIFYLHYIRNGSLWTPLDCAAAKGWPKTARVLLEADSPVDPMDKTKVTKCKNYTLDIYFYDVRG